MPEEEFDKIRKLSRSPCAIRRKGTGKGRGKGDGPKPYRELENGIKEPRYCVSFFRTGAYDWENEEPWKEVLYPSPQQEAVRQQVQGVQSLTSSL